METKVNSFTETVNNLVLQSNIALQSLVSINESLTTQADSVNMTINQIDPETGDNIEATYPLPSYYNVINKVNALSNTVDVFVKGEGVVLLEDGTYRQVSTVPVAKAPTTITNVEAPTKFTTRSNWFFESMMFPQLIVSFDLKNKIDDRSDRVLVKRIIFDNFSENETRWFVENTANIARTYYETITFFTNNGKKYWEDEEVQNLPLYAEPFTGSFIIIDKQTIDNKEWYYLDSLDYGVTSDTPVVNGYRLSIGDQLRYNNSVFVINDIQTNEKRVQLIPKVGMEYPTINNSFNIYNTPFSSKVLNIPIGYNECNVIFIKGVNDDFNIVGDDWGDSISFHTNSLKFDDSVTTLETYYNSYVSDFGRQLEGQAKEKFIPAYFGITPDAPTIQASQFSVTQVNTQLNAALDTNNIKTTQTQIESVKTIIDSLKSTIASQKSALVSLTDVAARSSLSKSIDNNISLFSKRTVEYQSLVRSLATLAYENNAILVSPKYRVRGFFDIPLGKTSTTNSNETPQEIIQFEIAYRYLRLDNTANPLMPYAYTDPSSGQAVNGTFTDWTIVQSPIKIKTWDSISQKYVWKEENISDGDTVNINQVDIAITKGEKVQLKIRSISEAGWPSNPLKSVWSNPVIIDFPSNIEGSSQVVNILLDAQSEETTIKLEETLNAAGVVSHLQDGVPNPNSGTGTYFKHQAEFIAYDLPSKDQNGNITAENVVDLQSVIVNLPNKTYVTLTRPTGAALAEPAQLTVTLQQLFQAIVNKDPSIYENLSI
jgi:hypothetical protein